MKYDLIFSDFDGTLARKNSVLSDYTINTIKEYVKRGGIFVLCTGRNDASARQYVKTLGIENQKISVVCLEGSLVYDNDGKVLYDQPLDWQTSKKIVEFFENHSVYTHVYDRVDVIVDELNEINTNYKNVCRVSLKVVGKLSEYVDKTQLNCQKILAVIPENEINKYKSLFDELNLDGVESFMSSRVFFETISKNAGKESGMKAVAKYYGVPMEKVMAFGDNGNDVGMIRDAGFGVAVENAREEVKAVANYICPSNQEDGVAQTIRKLCFNE